MRKEKIYYVPELCVAYGTPQELSEGELKEMVSRIYPFDCAVYGYANRGFEGSGNLIYRKDGKYFHHDLSHCSCFGPIEKLYHDDLLGHLSLKKLQEKCSEELTRDISPLIVKMREIRSKKRRNL